MKDVKPTEEQCVNRGHMSAEELNRMRELALAAGKRIARRVFEKRGNHSEAHLDESTLAAVATVAFECGHFHGERRGLEMAAKLADVTTKRAALAEAEGRRKP